MNRHERNELDRHITGNYGEDQLANDFKAAQRHVDDCPICTDLSVIDACPIFADTMPPDFEELTIAEEQAAADEQWRNYLEREGITEEEALANALAWCDSQD